VPSQRSAPQECRSLVKALLIDHSFVVENKKLRLALPTHPFLVSNTGNCLGSTRRMVFFRPYCALLDSTLIQHWEMERSEKLKTSQEPSFTKQEL
jgi:hypothetical protein